MPQSSGILALLTESSELAARIVHVMAQLSWKIVRYPTSQDVLDAAREITAVITDFQLGEKTAADLQRQLLERGVRTPFVLISDEKVCPHSMLNLNRNGCFQILSSKAELEQITNTISGLKQTAAIYQHCENERRRFRQLFDSLSTEERAVARYIVDGQPNKSIASQFDVSLRTIESRRAKIFAKTGLASVCELAKWLAIIDGKVISLEKADERLPRDVAATVVQLLVCHDQGLIGI